MKKQVKLILIFIAVFCVIDIFSDLLIGIIMGSEMSYGYRVIVRSFFNISGMILIFSVILICSSLFANNKITIYRQTILAIVIFCLLIPLFFHILNLNTNSIVQDYKLVYIDLFFFVCLPYIVTAIFSVFVFKKILSYI